jgi:hypothetical protein
MADSSAGTAKKNEAGASPGAASKGRSAKPSGRAASSLARQDVRKRRTRVVRTFPASSFMEALPIAEAIQRFGAGQKIRRLTLFDNLGRSPDSGPSRQLVTNAAQYALTKGSYNAEYLELTEDGKLASGDESLGRARLAARLELAINRIDPFRATYEQFQANRLPSLSVLRDFVIEHDTRAEVADECVETFLANARDLGLIRNYAGAERLLTFDMLLEEVDGGDAPKPELEVPRDELGAPVPIRELGEPARRVGLTSPAQVLAEASDLSKVCFLVSPIGSEGSDERKHANLVLGSLVEPALEGLDLRLVRADRISKPGVITAQVIDHIVRAPLVIADLSFGNPNVFYELALRHACKKPAVQLIRSSDHLPFDVGQFRTVVLDMTDIFSLFPQIDSYRAEIARQCRAALDEEGPVDSPLSLFYPQFWKQF